MAEVCRLYGIPTSLGAAWGVLFANPRALSLTEVAAAMGVAKSTASTTLKRLEHLRMVRRTTRPGDRSDYFEPVTDPHQLLREWLERFVKPELGLSGQMHDRMLEGVRRAEQAGDFDETEAAILERRLDVLESTTAQVRALVDAYLAHA